LHLANADVVIIGGGVIGSSIAYRLAKRKIKTHLIEKGDIASGSSGACDGLIFLQSKKPGIHLRLALESRGIFDQLREELAMDIEYKSHGGMVIVENERELEAMGRFVREQQAIGLDVAMLDRDQARELEPSLSEKILGSTFSPLDGQVNPILLTLAFVRAARRLGATVLTDTGVTGVSLRSGRVRAVQTTRGEVETECAVNAAGVFAPEIGRMVGLAVPIQPRRGQILVTETLPPRVRRGLLSAKYIAAKFDPSLAEREGVGFSLEQTENGNLLIGSTREFVGFDWRTTYEGMASIAEKIVRVIPDLAGVHVIRTYAGLRPYTPDGLPILGKVKEVGGFIMAAGHEGDGIALSPITGEVIASLIATGESSLPLEEFRLERFASP